jgi:hypothetical protein
MRKAHREGPLKTFPIHCDLDSPLRRLEADFESWSIFESCFFPLPLRQHSIVVA